MGAVEQADRRACTGSLLSLAWPGLVLGSSPSLR
jgi:hypothetical protein